jgi:hypothetical protein
MTTNMNIINCTIKFLSKTSNYLVKEVKKHYVCLIGFEGIFGGMR